MTASSPSTGQRKKVCLVLTCVMALLSSGVFVLTATAPAFAVGPPSVKSADRVYPVENTTMNFTGIDPISANDRSISVANTIEGTNCDDSKGNNYSPDNCPRVQMSLSTTDAGLLNIPGLETESDSPDGLDHIVAPSGAVITNSSSGVDPSQLFDFNGTQTQINDTLATLQFIPAANYRENRLAASDGTLPDLNIEVINGDGGLNDTVDTNIKVEGANLAPSIVVHQASLNAVVDQQRDFIDGADATDPEMCTAAICGLPYTNTTPIADPDASVLLVAWLDANCGKFDFPGAQFTSNGSASNNNVDSLLLNAVIDDNADNGYNSDQRTAIENSIDPAALGLDLTQETGNASQDTTVFGGIGDLDNVDYALSHIEYTAPADPQTCHLNVAISDLGNDGLPASFNDTSDPNYEVPDAKGASGQVTFDVMDTHPQVTVEQTPPSPGPGPDPGVDPTHTAANYLITFDQGVDDFNPTTDLDTSGSTIGLEVSCTTVPITPDLAWKATCVGVTPHMDGTIKLTVPAGAAHASGHDGDPNYANNASTSHDNTVTWDVTDPSVTIDPDIDDGQTDPATTSPIKYTVTFSETTNADVAFAGDDIDLSQSTAGGTLVASISGPQLPLHPNQYTVTVTGMTTAGDVIATVPAGSVTDEALNPNDASTSTNNDNDIQWQPSTSAAYTVTFDANGGAGTMAPETEDGATALSLNAFTRAGYSFDDWNTAQGGTGTSYADGAIYPFTSSITLYAQWAASGGGGGGGGGTPPTPTSFTITVNGSTAASITAGQSATLGDPGLPSAATGTVTFMSGLTVLCSFTLSAATSSCLTSATLPAGTYVIIGSFVAGDSKFANSTSTNSVTLTVNKAIPPTPTPTPPSPPPPAPPPTTPGGYDLVGSDGGVFVFENAARFFGSLPGLGVQVTNIVGLVTTSDDMGYFLVGSDGGVFAFGGAQFEGSLPGIGVHLGDIVGIVPTQDDKGYFLVGKDGGVFAFGDAPYEGSLPGMGTVVGNIVGIAATPTDKGYWVVGSDGHVYAFGDATNYGSATGQVTAIAAAPDGGGYWLTGPDGGVFGFGDAGFFGSLPAIGVNVSNIVSVVPNSDGKGYLLIGGDGGMFAFGDATFLGSLPGLGVHVTNIVGAVPTG